MTSSRRNLSPIRTRGGSGLPTGVERAAAFLRQQSAADREAIAANPRGLAKMMGLTVDEAREAIAQGA